MDPDAGFKVFSIRSDDQKVREYRRRKEHKKTKHGCIACRAKKVKCDETRPVCLRCSRNNRECVYEQTDDGSESDQPGGHVPVSATTAGLASLSVTALDPSIMPGSNNGTPSAQLWLHLEQNRAEIFQMRGSDKIMSFSQTDSLVRNVLLALAACHLRQKAPGVVQHRIAEHFQQSEALHDFQKALDTPRQELGEDGVNSMVLSAILLGQIAFALPASETANDGASDLRASWVFSQGEDQLSWLSLQVGLGPLIDSVATYGDPALDFISAIFVEPMQPKWWAPQIVRELRGMPTTWSRVLIFDLDIPVHFQASALLELRDMQPRGSNIFQALVFLGSVDSNFCHLLYTRDEKALWMFGYWLGLVSRFEDVWWTRQRAIRDHKAICLWLEQQNLGGRPGAEGEAWRIMLRELELAPNYGMGSG